MPQVRRRCEEAREHTPLRALLVIASVVASVVYTLVIPGGSPRQDAIDDPRLDTLDLTGDKPRALWRDDDFECLGWRATFACNPHGQRDFARDRGCDAPLPRTSGYCAVRNRTSGQVFHVMLATCSSWWWRKVPSLACRDARQFTDFSIRAAQFTHPPALLPASLATATHPHPIDWSRGIALIAYPKVIAGVYAIVRLLRFHGCALPIELWIDPREMVATHSILQALTTSKHFNCRLRTLDDPAATHFFAKPYVVYHTQFESVLFMDSDNLPLQDPTFLFESPAFLQFGTIFWPDYWQPTLRESPFNIHRQSALWQVLDMPFIDMFEQESGQLLINRTRTQRALEKLQFYATRTPLILSEWALLYGDKDLFRLAWVNTTTPFAFGQHLLALGGLFEQSTNSFCGVAMLQQDARGDFVFAHRNMIKLNGRSDQKPVITHVQKFTGGNGDATTLPQHLEAYRIECKRQWMHQRMCFRLMPFTPTGDRTPLIVQSLATTTSIPAIEQRAIRYSIEGRRLLTATEEATLLMLEEEDGGRVETVASMWKRVVVLVLVVVVVVAVGWRNRTLLLRWRQQQATKDRRFSI